MRAPRAMADSRSSRMTTPEPSPMMNPSRSLSNGRLALSGSSLRVDMARIAANPPTLMGVIAASDPPAIIASASPRRMISDDSPIACADAEHAVHVARFGPLAPKRIDTWPDARADEDTDIGSVGIGNHQLGVVHRELRRGDGVLNEDVHLLDVFLLDVI